MKNLEKAGVEPLNDNELSVVNGGDLGFTLLRGALTVMYHAVKETLSDPEKYYGAEVDGALGQVKL
ncbi:hypothetical protein M0D21_20465 [Aquimarina sp. D1M17]|uniref:hypothetical protein n=1 Tax=Aquimarina acroporae TaxID=2937283 RepID=UPI0020C114FF|nr:hypothetical protein [Aquimarina acroporae]MCK8523962.1 hypothetical protein [Aquimarina acroporae]